MKRAKKILAVWMCILSVLFVSGCVSFDAEKLDVQIKDCEAVESVCAWGEKWYRFLFGLQEKPALTDTWNVLLIGSDRRDTSWNGNSDTMILISVNPSSKRIHMVSFMRDTQVNIPGYGARKLNSAYAIGGAPLLIQTLQTNFQVPIHNYISVDFSAMENVINELGGVTIEINEAEAQYLQSRGYAVAAGPVYMDGALALTYSRIRYVGHADYERTQRQRRVLTQIFGQLRGKSGLSLISVITKMMNYVTTDFTPERLVWITSNASAILGYELDSDRIPYDGLYSHNGENLVPDYQATILRLQALLAQ